MNPSCLALGIGASINTSALLLACEFVENQEDDYEISCSEFASPASAPSPSSRCPFSRAIQPENRELKGTLSGCGKIQDWCGGAGSEDVYLLQPLDDIDISFALISDQSDFSPILRVFSYPLNPSPEWSCETSQPPQHQPICQTLSSSDPRASFFARSQQQYLVVVDSETGLRSQTYTIAIEYGATKSLDNCPDHLIAESFSLPIPSSKSLISPQFITSSLNIQQQEEEHLGSTPKKVWISRHGMLSPGQGILHSRCGGSGSEHVFAIQLEEPGFLNLRVISDNRSFEPILTLRDNCSGNGVIEIPTNCDSTEVTFQSELSYENLDSDVKYIVVDQRGVSGGGYRLYISYEPFLTNH